MAVHGIIGRKVGMTQVFEADGTAVPVTVVQAGPCLVVQRKSADKDGYEPDGVVTVDELTSYLDKEIPNLAQANGKTKEEKQQLHFVLGSRELIA